MKPKNNIRWLNIKIHQGKEQEMRYKLLGKSGLKVSEIALGTMTFGEEWGWGASKEESRKIYDAYRKAGGNFVDTANRYTGGTSEKYVGEFIKSEREEIVLATKYTLVSREGDPNSAGNSRKNMIQSLEASLKRLGTDYIDLYWLHAWDHLTPVEEVMRAFDDMIRSGKIVYAGVSDTPAWVVARANMMAELRGWSPFVALQIEYSLIERTVERELLPMARELGMAVTPWAVMGGGLLTGKYNKQTDEPKRMKEGDSRRINEHNLKIAEEVVKIADELGKKPGQVAIDWVRQKPGLIIPIIGARNVKQLEESLGALEFTLSDEHIKRLDNISQIDLGFPNEFLTRDFITRILYAGMRDKIDSDKL
jgi:aryl-alcohol dehydrogenase-like predicted oxidoreductase